MNRVIAAVTAVAATAALAIAAVTAGAPAQAAPRPPHAVTAVIGRAVGREFGRGNSVRIVRCTRAIATPGVHPGVQPGQRVDPPVRVGTTVYTCTVIVAVKGPGRAPVRAAKGRKTASGAGHGRKVCGKGCSRIVTLTGYHPAG